MGIYYWCDNSSGLMMMVVVDHCCMFWGSLAGMRWRKLCLWDMRCAQQSWWKYLVGGSWWYGIKSFAVENLSSLLRTALVTCWLSSGPTLRSYEVWSCDAMIHYLIWGDENYVHEICFISSCCCCCHCHSWPDSETCVCLLSLLPFKIGCAYSHCHS